MIRNILFLIFFLSFFQNVHATPAATELANQLNAIHTMRADFTQIIYDNHGKAVQKSYGHMAIQRPGKFRWETLQPIPQLIVANQSQLSIYDEDLEQLTIRSLQAAAGDTPALLLSHVNVVLEQNYTVTASTNSQWFTLTPKKADNMFASIQLGFSNQQIKQMRLRDHLGHNTLIQFSNTQINKPLSANLFTIKVPANVDIIDETKRK